MAGSLAVEGHVSQISGRAVGDIAVTKHDLYPAYDAHESGMLPLDGLHTMAWNQASRKYIRHRSCGGFIILAGKYKNT